MQEQSNNVERNIATTATVMIIIIIMIMTAHTATALY